MDRLPEPIDARLQGSRRQSASWWARGQQVIPSGTSGRRRAIPPHPFYSLRGEGSRLFDVDGNQYIDCVNGYGPVFLGHGHPVVREAIAHAAELGTTFGTPHIYEVELAEELVRGIPCADKVTFTNTGSAATETALRVARVATGKPGIAKFEGGFHGTYDAVLGSFGFEHGRSGGVEDPVFVSLATGAPRESLAHTHVLPFNHEAAFDKITRLAPHLALVMVEAVQCFGGAVVADVDWLRQLAKTCEVNGVLLMLDEVATGFRLGYGGAQRWFDVEPDLATYGKVPGGGLPLGVIAGTEDAMRMLGTTGDSVRDLSERAYFGGTYNAGLIVTAVGIAILRYLRRHPEIYETLTSHGEALRAGVKKVAEEASVPVAVTGTGSIWGVHFADKPVSSVRDIPPASAAVRSTLQAYLLAEGVFVSPTFGVLSAAHTAEDVSEVVAAYARAFQAMKADGAVPEG